MKFTCPKQELLTAIGITSKAISSKPQTPILSGIYLRAEGNQLELQSTDYEIGIIYQLAADIDEHGQLVLSGRYLQEVIRRLPGDVVSISYDNQEKITHIQGGNANYTLRSMNASEYPGVHRLEGDLRFTIKDNLLRSLFKKTVFACSNDESRPVFTGVNMDIDGTTITLAGTNTHRLAVKKQVFDEPVGAMKLIIPAKTISEVLRILTSEVPSDVEVTCSFNQISFQYENIYFTGRLIEGAFPSFTNVIPKNGTTCVTMNTAELVSAMERVYLISRTSQYNFIKLSFADGNLHMYSSNPDIGMAEENVPASMEGPAIDIAFNADYLIDALKVLESESCTFALTKPLAPVLITEPDDPYFIYVVTPMRTMH